MTPAPTAPPPDSLPSSAAAQRNRAPILAVLQSWLPAQAQVLEVASGTGEHAEHALRHHSGWHWQPTEADARWLPVIDRRCAGLAGARPARLLNLLQPDTWQPLNDFIAPTAPPGRAEPAVAGPDDHPTPTTAGCDAVFAANLLHISPPATTPALMQLAARVLRPGGRLVTYGPYRVQGEATAPSNEDFERWLQAQDPAWGLRWLHQVQAAASAAGLVWQQRQDMPANNLMLCWTWPGPAAQPTRSPA